MSQSLYGSTGREINGIMTTVRRVSLPRACSGLINYRLCRHRNTQVEIIMENFTQNKQNKKQQQQKQEILDQQERFNELKKQNQDLQKRIERCVSRTTKQQEMNGDLRKLEIGIKRMMKNYQKKKTMERKEQRKRKMDRQSASNGNVALAQNWSQSSWKKVEELVDSLAEERAFRAMINEQERINLMENMDEFDFEPEEDEEEEQHRYWQEFLYWYEEEDYLMMPRFLFEEYEVESSDEYMVGYNMNDSMN